MTVDPADLPNYRPHPESPQLEAGTGRAIRIAAPARVAASGPFPLYGCFRVPESDEAGLSAHVMQTVVVLIRGPLPASRRVADGEILFHDDVARSGGLIHGFFNLDLFDHFNLEREPNCYWITASVRDCVSEILTVEVTGPGAGGGGSGGG